MKSKRVAPVGVVPVRDSQKQHLGELALAGSGFDRRDQRAFGAVAMADKSPASQPACQGREFRRVISEPVPPPARRFAGASAATRRTPL